jgi:serine/threonine-protein kinase
MTIDLPPSDDGRFSMASLAGTVVAQKYELLRLLGQGGMGAVFEARNRDTLKRCAVKLLTSQDFGHQSDAVRRFFNEARASSVIESDHIVTIYDSGVDPAMSAPYMVMELLRGEDLEQLVERVGVLPPEIAVKIVMQAATGLAKAHAAGIVHRDIKPANLFLTQRDSGEILVKLLDFGIAKVKLGGLGDTKSHALTRTGAMLGTPLYMSPEQARGQTDIDAKSDVWSLGVVLYELASGGVPYGSVETLGDLIVAIITAEIPPVQESAPWISPGLAAVISRALSRDRAERYPTAAELAQALAALSPEGARLVPEMLVSLPAERRGNVAPRAIPAVTQSQASTKTGFARTDATPPPSRAPLLLLAATLVVLVGLGGGALVLYLRAQKAPDAVLATEQPSATAPEPKRFLLTVPKDASAKVNGKPTTVSNDKLEIVGLPGAAIGVEISRGNQRVEKVVAVTEAGLVPAEIELPEVPVPSAHTPEPKPQRPREAPAPKEKPAAASTKSAPSKPITPPGIDTSDKDFQ